MSMNCFFLGCKIEVTNFYTVSHGAGGCGHHMAYCGVHAQIMRDGWTLSGLASNIISKEIFELAQTGDHSQCPQFMSDQERSEMYKQWDREELELACKGPPPKAGETWKHRRFNHQVEVITDFIDTKCKIKYLAGNKYESVIYRDELIKKLWQRV